MRYILIIMVLLIDILLFYFKYLPCIKCDRQYCNINQIFLIDFIKCIVRLSLESYVIYDFYTILSYLNLHNQINSIMMFIFVISINLYINRIKIKKYIYNIQHRKCFKE